MIALVRMRLAAFVRSGRALAPLIAGAVVLGIIHGGGQSRAAPAYGYSAAVLFPVLAWTSKLVLDAEPDVQRQLARLTVGARRELAAGLLAAATIALAVCAAAMLVPLPFHAGGGPHLGPGIVLGVLAHLLMLPAAVALGALASRAVTRSIRTGVTVLVSGSVLMVVLGMSGSVVPWLVPPVMATGRALSRADLPPAGTLLLLSGWAVAWSAVALTGYGYLRRRRS